MPEFILDHAAVQRLTEDAEKLIQQFFLGVPHALQRHREFSPPSPRTTLGEDTKYREESFECIARIQSAIEIYRDELMRQAASDILAYLTRHSVRSISCDPGHFEDGVCRASPSRTFAKVSHNLGNGFVQGRT